MAKFSQIMFANLKFSLNAPIFHRNFYGISENPKLLRQGFLSHSGPLPGLDLVFCRADPVLAIRSHDVNRYTCFSSEFLFGPLNAGEIFIITGFCRFFRNFVESWAQKKKKCKRLVDLRKKIHLLVKSRR